MSGPNKVAAAVWDEVQGACDASRLQRALETLGDASLELDSWTPLHFACENRSVSDATRAAAIRMLTARGIDANTADENGWTSLHLLSKNKHADALEQSLQELLACGADASRVTSDATKTALHLLCENETATIASLTLLVKATQSVDAIDADGNVPLHYLTENQALTPDLLTALLSAKANPNIQNQFLSTPFHNLCQRSALSPLLVTTMLQHKANPNVPNNIGNTPFHYACENYALTLDLLHAFLTSQQVNLTTTNALGKTALDLIPSHKPECLAIAHKLGVPSLGAAAAISASSAHDAATPGGEDPSELAAVAPSLASQLAAWNASLPPFDMAFYNAVCCEPLFASAYEHVQDVSVQISEAPTDRVLLQDWTTALAAWRTQLVLAFTALVAPNLWDAYVTKYNRTIPADVANVRGAVVDAWTQFPGPTHRRERFEKLGSTFSPHN